MVESLQCFCSVTYLIRPGHFVFLYLSLVSLTTTYSLSSSIRLLSLSPSRYRLLHACCSSSVLMALPPLCRFHHFICLPPYHPSSSISNHDVLYSSGTKYSKPSLPISTDTPSQSTQSFASMAGTRTPGPSPTSFSSLRATAPATHLVGVLLFTRRLKFPLYYVSLYHRMRLSTKYRPRIFSGGVLFAS